MHRTGVDERISDLAIVPWAFLLHNIEEALTIPGMLPHAEATLGRVLGSDVTLPSANQYHIVLLAITGAAFAWWLMALRHGALSYGLVVLQATMALNVLNHLGAAILMGGYAPGVITAVAIEGTTTIVVYRRVKCAGWISNRQWALLPVLAILIHGPILMGCLSVISAL